MPKIHQGGRRHRQYVGNEGFMWKLIAPISIIGLYNSKCHC